MGDVKWRGGGGGERDIDTELQTKSERESNIENRRCLTLDTYLLPIRLTVRLSLVASDVCKSYFLLRHYGGCLLQYNQTIKHCESLAMWKDSAPIEDHWTRPALVS